MGIASGLLNVWRGSRLVAAAVMALCASGATVEAQRLQGSDRSAIPIAFRGTWASDLSKCDSDDDDGPFIVEERRVRFYEHRFEVRRVRAQGDVLVLEGMSEITGEEGLIPDTIRFRLSGFSLVLNGNRYVKCPV